MDFSCDENVRLMLKFKEGDDLSFNALLDKYHVPIINFLYRFTGSKHDAEDLAQETFLRVYRCRYSYQPKAKLSTWIYCIARRLALNALRQKAGHKTSSLEDLALSEGQDTGIEFADKVSNSPSKELERKELGGIIK